MRASGFLLLMLLACPVEAAKLDSTIYPNANFYRDPAIAVNPSLGYSKVIREYCPGFGRGLIHFLNVDDQLIRIRKTWPTYLELAPGRRRIDMEFMGTASDIWGSWQGSAEVDADFAPGKTYVMRYQRVATDAFRVWVEEFDGFDAVSMATVTCKQPEYPDKSLHQ